MTLKEIQLKLYESLEDSGWSTKLKMFLLSKDFLSILQVLYTNAQTDKRFTPTLKDLFRAFIECPYGELKVVIINSDPYANVGVADGIAFSCSKDQEVQPALKYMFKEIDKTVYPDGHTWNPDLSRWSNQGVLLLNTALTTQLNKLGVHKDLWAPFTTYLLDTLADYNSGLIYVFVGEKAKEWHKLVSTDNYKFFTTHPISAKYHSNDHWDSGNLFNQINKVVFETYGEKIIW